MHNEPPCKVIGNRIRQDVYKKTISYCVKSASDQVHQQRQIGATGRELDGRMVL